MATKKEAEKQRRLDEIPKTYDPQATEQPLYSWWETNGYFKPRPSLAKPDRRPFVISMPPPNVTGALHIGHALTATIEDIMIRYHRMLGDETLWVPGEDHAGIATQAVVERELAKEGTDRHELGTGGLCPTRLGVGSCLQASHPGPAPPAWRLLRLGSGAVYAGRWTGTRRSRSFCSPV